jgi:hypothetical protein
MSNSSNPVREVRSQAFECDVCGVPLEPSQAVQLPDLGGMFNVCCPDCTTSERFFDTVERDSTTFFLQLLADVPETLKTSILETLDHAITGAQMLCTAKPKGQPRRVSFLAAIENGSSFGAKLKALGMMPDPCAFVAADGVFLEGEGVFLDDLELIEKSGLEKLEQRAERRLERVAFGGGHG